MASGMLLGWQAPSDPDIWIRRTKKLKCLQGTLSLRGSGESTRSWGQGNYIQLTIMIHQVTQENVKQ
eukprot:1157745-Pelagomonas_calceolata.AAC.5